MGYDLRVTRAEHWYDNTGREITKDEWVALVRETPDLRHSMDWSRGNLVSKNPDAEAVAQMVAAADRLGARVEGDDGETYLPDGRVRLADGQMSPDQDWRQWVARD